MVKHQSLRREAIQRLTTMPVSHRRQETRKKLLSAGATLFIKQGILGTSVVDICEHAGFSRGAFYSNFADMDHFIQILADDQWQQILTTTLELFSDDTHSFASGASDDDTLAIATELASRLLAALPISRDFYLLLAEFSIYLARARNSDSPLFEGAENFKRGLAEAITAKLTLVGRRSLLSPLDTVNMILALAERSMNLALTHQREDLTAYLVRTLPPVLVRLTVPID